MVTGATERCEIRGLSVVAFFVPCAFHSPFHRPFLDRLSRFHNLWGSFVRLLVLHLLHRTSTLTGFRMEVDVNTAHLLVLDVSPFLARYPYKVFTTLGNMQTQDGGFPFVPPVSHSSHLYRFYVTANGNSLLRPRETGATLVSRQVFLDIRALPSSSFTVS